MSAGEKSLKFPLLRCPVCFSREIDVNLLRDPSKGHLYCVKCSFTGDETRVQAMYQQQREKYLLISARLTLQSLREG